MINTPVGLSLLKCENKICLAVSRMSRVCHKFGGVGGGGVAMMVIIVAEININIKKMALISYNKGGPLSGLGI